MTTKSGIGTADRKPYISLVSLIWLVCAASGAVFADDCSTLIDQRVKHLKSADGYSSYVRLVANTSQGTAYYGEGTVGFDKKGTAIEGSMKIVSNSQSQYGGGVAPWAAFGKKSEEKKLSIDPKSGKVTLGDSTISGLQCLGVLPGSKNGLMHGRAVPKAGGLGGALSTLYYILSFEDGGSETPP